MVHTADPPSAADLNLSECEREPIRIPGSIQPHGALFVLDPDTLVVLQASANTGALLGAPSPLGRKLAEAAPSLAPVFHEALSQWAADEDASFLQEVQVAHRVFYAAAHHSNGGILLEFEIAPPAEPAAEAPFTRLRAYAEALSAARSYERLCEVAADQIRELNGFDRVLVYRFDPDWNGQVVAEARNGVLPSCQHLRFPASDIPAQARELYRLNRLRIIPDVNYEPVPIEPSDSPRTGGPLDLSFAGLRSVSPVHREYMRNMDTAASMSVSIIVDGELWGLIACHNRGSKLVPLPARQTCEFATQMFAMQLASRAHVEEAAHGVALAGINARLLAWMAQADSFQAGLVVHADALLSLTDSAGAVVVTGGEMHALGVTPPGERIREIMAFLDEQGRPELFHAEAIGAHVPSLQGSADAAAGVLAISLSETRSEYLIWFRPEIVRTVEWAGDPRKNAPGMDRIQPRKSFESWKEQVRLRSAPWRATEVAAARALRAGVMGIVIRKAEALAQLNEELRRSNKELEAFSYSVSHDLRAPFRHIVGYSELLREQDLIEGKARHYVDSIAEAAVSAGRLVDDLLNFSHLGRTALEPTRIDMNKLAEEARRSVETHGECRIDWRMPRLADAWGDPAMIRQVMLNLVDNAAKYSRTRDPAVIEINGSVTERETIYYVRDNGVGFDQKYVGKIFGVFQRLHRAEDFEGTGIGLALVRRIIDRHKGRVWADGELDRGATLWFALPRPPEERRLG